MAHQPGARAAPRASALHTPSPRLLPPAPRQAAHHLLSSRAQVENISEDAGGGDMELIRSQWLTLLEFAGYDEEQFARVYEALCKCGGSGDSFAADVLKGEM